MALVSADSLQLAMVEEVTPGVTPATPAFMVWRLTGESLTFSPNTAENDELGGAGRSQRPADVVGHTVNGSIEFRMAKFPAFDECIAAVLANEWGQCPLTGLPGGGIDAGRNCAGETVKTYTIEKRFPDPENPGQYFYQRYKGCTFSALTISTAPNAPITCSVTVVGGVPTLDSAAIAGATYTPAGTGASFTAPEVLEMTVGADLDIGTNCWTSLELLIDSANRGVPCIGSTGDREVVLGTLQATVSGDVYFQDQKTLEHLLANTAMGDGVFTFQNADGDVYRFDFFGLKPVSGNIAAGGAGEDLTVPLEMQPNLVTVCDNAGDIWEAGFIVSQQNSAPTLP